MRLYRIVLLFSNLDNSLYTDYQANMFFEIQADHKSHAKLLAEHLQKKFQADNYLVEQNGKN